MLIEKYFRDLSDGDFFIHKDGILSVKISKCQCIKFHNNETYIIPNDIIINKVEFKKPILKFQLLSENAKEPTRGTCNSSGLDVYSPIDCVVPARGDYLIPLDLRFDTPEGYDLSVYNKSGICTKKKLFKGAELIDQDYKGNCHIHFFNHSDVDVEIKKGDKISQLVLRPVCISNLERVENIELIGERKDKGFGSTGDK